jgi:poly(hydroxyalkanoate) granule-associated protein
MAGKSPKAGSPEEQAARLSDTVRDSAQQIWLAGLGAFAKAQEEGGKVFDSLVKEGSSIQQKTQAAAQEKMSGAASRMAGVATEISSKASGQWGKLESIFEDRVSKALKTLGVPTAAEVDALAARVDELQRELARRKAPSAAAAPARKTVRSPAKAAAKKPSAARKPG